MIILAIDSAMSGCLVCVYDADQDIVLAKDFSETIRGQAENLMPMIESVMEQGGVSYDSLDLIGVTKGPGAFTGMRIAMATAKTIGLATGKPVAGVSTLHAVFESYLEQVKANDITYPYYALILETKRKDYYFQMFKKEDDATKKKQKEIQSAIENMKEIESAKVADYSDIVSIISEKKIILIGDASKRFMKEAGKAWPEHVIKSPSGRAIAKLAAKIYRNSNGAPMCTPLYLRGAEIGIPKNKPRTIKT